MDPEHFISTHCRTLWIYESLFNNQFWQFSVSNCTGLDLQTPTCRLYRCPGCSGPFLCPPNCHQVWANIGQSSCRWSHMNQELQLQKSLGTNLEKTKEKQAQMPWMSFDPQLHNWIYIWRLERNKVTLFLEDFISRSETQCWHGDVIQLVLRWMKYKNMLFWIYLEGLSQIPCRTIKPRRSCLRILISSYVTHKHWDVAFVYTHINANPFNINTEADLLTLLLVSGSHWLQGFSLRQPQASVRSHQHWVLWPHWCCSSGSCSTYRCRMRLKSD